MRYVFNEAHKTSPLGKDFELPPLIKDLADHSFVGGPHREDKDLTRFQFMLGPALSGAHIHAHASAWNGLVFGRKRWFVMPPKALKMTKEEIEFHPDNTNV